METGNLRLTPYCYWEFIRVPTNGRRVKVISIELLIGPVINFYVTWLTYDGPLAGLHADASFTADNGWLW